MWVSASSKEAAQLQMCKRREKKMLVTNEMKSGIYRDLIFNILLNKA